MNPPKVNERWRVALAGLVAALAIPFLVIDSPAPAEGVVETNSPPSTTTTSTTTTFVAADEPELNNDGLVVVAAEIAPDISRLADQASTWNIARGQAIADGLVAVNTIPPPSDTDLSLLPVVSPAPEPEPATEPDAVDPAAVEPDPVEPEPTPETAVPEPDPDPVEEPAPDPAAVDPDPAEQPDDGDEPTEPTEPAEPEPDPEPVPEPIDPVIEDPGPTAPRAPAQVDGRVPPPAGGPTAAQWDAVRKCESTHNYAAISPTGLYRGAYQFSQVTWDWVAGIHQPHLVGIDPINAEPAWQDVMAYTLYAMRGWDQWPICGKNLL